MATATIMFDVGAPSTMGGRIDVSKDLRLLLSSASSEEAVWQFRLPTNYDSAPVAKIQYAMASATTGTVNFKVSIMAVTDGDSQDLDVDSYDTANSGSATVPGTAGYLDEMSVSLVTIDGMAAGDYCRIKLRREGDSVAGGDAEVRNFVVEYTTA